MNAEDGHPSDPSCSVQDEDNCSACGVGCEGSLRAASMGSVAALMAQAVGRDLRAMCVPPTWAGAACDTCAASWSGVDLRDASLRDALRRASSHLRAHLPSGAPECWGWNNEGQSSPPEGAFIALSCGPESYLRAENRWSSGVLGLGQFEGQK